MFCQQGLDNLFRLPTHLVCFKQIKKQTSQNQRVHRDTKAPVLALIHTTMQSFTGTVQGSYTPRQCWRLTICKCWQLHNAAMTSNSYLVMRQENNLCLVWLQEFWRFFHPPMQMTLIIQVLIAYFSKALVWEHEKLLTQPVKLQNCKLNGIQNNFFHKLINWNWKQVLKTDQCIHI